MAEEDKIQAGRTGLYERAVEWVTEKFEDYLHKKTAKFVKKSIDKYAPDDPKYAEMIEFEVRRRGDGPGLTQDVAEPLVWTGVKTAFALLVAVIGKTFEHKEDGKKWPGRLKWVGLGGAAVIVANQAVELFRLIPRYTAGLQGSLRMAIERQKSIEAGHGDPFAKQQQRAINRPEDIKQSAAEQSQPTDEQTQKVGQGSGMLDSATASKAVTQQPLLRT